MRIGIQPDQRRDQLRRKPRGCVHRQVNSHQLGVANRRFIQRLPRQIQGHDRMAALAQPRRR